MIAAVLATALVIAALGWVRERALRQGDRARLRQAGAELEHAAEREAKLLETGRLGTQAALITMIGLYNESFGGGDDEPEGPHPEDDPAATRH